MGVKAEPAAERYETDFGLSGVTEGFVFARCDSAEDALALIVARLDADDAEHFVDWSRMDDMDQDQRKVYGWDVFHDDWGYIAELRQDLRALLDSRLPDDELAEVWSAATGGAWRPEAHGMSVRDWLRRIDETCAGRTPRKELGRRPGPYHGFWRPQPEGEMRNRAVAEIRRSGAALGRVAAPLERVAGDVNADLGYRLYLRAMKASSVPVDLDQYDRYQDLGCRFGHPLRLGHDGLRVLWPRFDATDVVRPRMEGVFIGLPWLGGTTDEDVRSALADRPGDVPGSDAYVALEDSLRLLQSPLSDETLGLLWRETSDRGDHADRLAADPRGALRRIAGLCVERLREIDPGFTPDILPARIERADEVLRMLDGRLPEPTADALTAVVTSVDPDLGQRFHTRILDERAKW
ncbi:hypothetical protein ACFYWX_21860 [Streptomyces sp. NPDC002888]|uniref:hypothetical protein n=1 Tax=Streptomyces sp. NPDC002888 TaxID=3364668 RepID=UPI0036A55AA4